MIRAFVPGVSEVKAKTKSEAIDKIRESLGIIPDEILTEEVVEYEYDKNGRPRKKK